MENERFESYLEAAKETVAKNKDMENSIIKVIKKADDDGLVEIAHYVLGDLGNYGDADEDIENMDMDQLHDDLIDEIKKMSSKSLSRLYRELQGMKLVGESESKIVSKEVLFEAISAMRKLKKFKDTKEAKAALDKDFEKLRQDLQGIEDTIADMVHEVAALLHTDDGESDEGFDEAFDQAHDMFSPLIKGVSSIDFKRVKERILTAVKKKIDSQHETESNAASEKAKAEAPATAE